MQNRPCPNCASTDVKWRKRRLLDVPRSWVRYVIDFVFMSTLSSGHFHKTGGMATPYTFRDPHMFDLPNRSDLRESLKQSNSTHRALATPRWFWRCRSCGGKGAVYDDYVLRDPATSEHRSRGR